MVFNMSPRGRKKGGRSPSKQRIADTAVARTVEKEQSLLEVRFRLNLGSEDADDIFRFVMSESVAQSFLTQLTNHVKKS